MHSSDYRGQRVLLNFWASWCGPCRDEMPAIDHGSKTLGNGGLQVIGVAMDQPAGARHFWTSHPVHYPIVLGQLDPQQYLDPG